MIDEAIGKILGMVMAYVASAMGMFVAYVNYRRRIVKADRVMTPAAWAVVASSVVAILLGAVIVGQLAAPAAAPVVDEVAEEAVEPAPTPEVPAEPAPARVERGAWPWVGIVLPAVIFLFATVVTAALHRHFSATTHG